MESRFLVLLLVEALALMSLTGCGRQRVIETVDSDEPPVIEPDVERREIKTPKIDTEDFEVGGFVGVTISSMDPTWTRGRDARISHNGGILRPTRRGPVRGRADELRALERSCAIAHR